MINYKLITRHYIRARAGTVIRYIGNHLEGFRCFLSAVDLLSLEVNFRGLFSHKITNFLLVSVSRYTKISITMCYCVYRQLCWQCARRLSTESSGLRFFCILFSDRFPRFVLLRFTWQFESICSIG